VPVILLIIAALAAPPAPAASASPTPTVAASPTPLPPVLCGLALGEDFTQQAHSLRGPLVASVTASGYAYVYGFDSGRATVTVVVHQRRVRYIGVDRLIGKGSTFKGTLGVALGDPMAALDAVLGPPAFIGTDGARTYGPREGVDWSFAIDHGVVTGMHVYSSPLSDVPLDDVVADPQHDGSSIAKAIVPIAASAAEADGAELYFISVTACAADQAWTAGGSEIARGTKGHVFHIYSATCRPTGATRLFVFDETALFVP
jgi:hypothetical protein